MGEVSYVHRSCGFCKVLKWKKFRPVEVLKMAIGPEKVLILVSVILQKITFANIFIFVKHSSGGSEIVAFSE